MNNKFLSIVFVFVFMGSITAMEIELKETEAPKVEKGKYIKIKDENNEKVKKIGIIFDPTFSQAGTLMSYYVAAVLYKHPEIARQRADFLTKLFFKKSFLEESRERWQKESLHVQTFGEQLYKFYGEIGARVTKVKTWPDFNLKTSMDGESAVRQYIVLKFAIDRELLIEKARAVPGIAALFLDQSYVAKVEKYIDSSIALEQRKLLLQMEFESIREDLHNVVTGYTLCSDDSDDDCVVQ